MQDEDESRFSRDYARHSRTFRQVKRLFVLAGIIEAEGCVTVGQAMNLYRQRWGERISERQIRRDLILLSELGVLEEVTTEYGGRCVFRYKFEGWPIAIH